MTNLFDNTTCTGPCELHFVIKMGDGTSSGSEKYVNISNVTTVTTSWQKVEVLFTQFSNVINHRYLEKPLILAFTDAYTGGDATVYFDYIGFTYNS